MGKKKKQKIIPEVIAEESKPVVKETRVISLTQMEKLKLKDHNDLLDYLSKIVGYEIVLIRVDYITATGNTLYTVGLVKML